MEYDSRHLFAQLGLHRLHRKRDVVEPDLVAAVVIRKPDLDARDGLAALLGNDGRGGILPARVIGVEADIVILRGIVVVRDDGGHAEESTAANT